MYAIRSYYELELVYRELAERVYDEAYLITPIALPFRNNFV